MEVSLDHNISGLMVWKIHSTTIFQVSFSRPQYFRSNGVEDSLDHNISGLMVWKIHSTTIFQV